ncbi:MAG: ribosome small subunit-dependent GTPase A, partial [Moraxella sp.]
MALIRKRKLTDQQTRRIQKQQKSQQMVNDEQLMDGIVVANFGKQLEVQATGLPLTLPSPPVVLPNEP